MDFGLRVVMSNRWLLGGVVAAQMGKKPSSNATLRTTQAVTMAEGSKKDNVLPQVARAVVNFRIVPGDTVASVTEHVQQVVGPGVSVSVLSGVIHSEPSPVSKTDGPAWEALNTAIRQTWPEAVVSPFLFIGATDSRFMTGNSERVWRFSPMALTSEDLKRLHGKDERISLENLENAAAFYVRFIDSVSR
jgi:carboxypeptidase PM20D1